jgi:hypothetical protein
MYELRQFADDEWLRRGEALRVTGPEAPPASVQMLAVWSKGGEPYRPLTTAIEALANRSETRLTLTPEGIDIILALEANDRSPGLRVGQDERTGVAAQPSGDPMLGLLLVEASHQPAIGAPLIVHALDSLMPGPRDSEVPRVDGAGKVQLVILFVPMPRTALGDRDALARLGRLPLHSPPRHIKLSAVAFVAFALLGLRL